MKFSRDKHSVLTGILAGLILLFLILCGMLFWQYRKSQRGHFGNPYQAILAGLRNKHAPLGEGDIDTVIQPWVTFDYVNSLFKLPPDYLKQQLSIQDSHYPRIHLSKYAKSQALDANTFLARVKEAVRAYMTPVVPVPAAR